MECDPNASSAVLKLAFPPLSLPVPIVAPPSLKVTAPVGVPVVADFTVAVKVTVPQKPQDFSTKQPRPSCRPCRPCLPPDSLCSTCCRRSSSHRRTPPRSRWYPP